MQLWQGIEQLNITIDCKHFLQKNEIDTLDELLTINPKTFDIIYTSHSDERIQKRYLNQIEKAVKELGYKFDCELTEEEFNLRTKERNQSIDPKIDLLEPITRNTEFNKSLFNDLSRNNIEVILDLLFKSPYEITSIRNVGLEKIRQLRKYLHENGLELSFYYKLCRNYENDQITEEKFEEEIAKLNEYISKNIEGLNEYPSNNPTKKLSK